jgi:hypothetical protein
VCVRDRPEIVDFADPGGLAFGCSVIISPSSSEPLSVPTPSVLKAPVFPAGALSPELLLGRQLLITLKVSNFDQTATKKRMILHVRPPERLPPDTPAACVRDPECVAARSLFLVAGENRASTVMIAAQTTAMLLVINTERCSAIISPFGGLS